MNSYTLTKQWFLFCSQNEEVTPIHTALYLWLAECNNQQQWRETFFFSFDEIETFVHISYKTFKKSLESLVKWEFVQVFSKPVNRFATHWQVSLERSDIQNSVVENTTLAGSSKGAIAMLRNNSDGRTPDLHACSVGVTSGAFPTLNGFSSGNPASPNVYIKTLLFSNNTNESENSHTHTHEENLKNSDSFFSENNSESVEVHSQEKKKSSAQKRKELFEREAEFKTAVFSFAKTYPAQHLQAFYDYWSEPDPQQNMRFELERTWELSRRISQWMRREPQFTKPQTNTYHEEALDYSIPL